MLTLRTVNKELEKRGWKNVELVKGDGYFYFWSTVESHWLDLCETTSVMVYRLNQLSLDSWMDEIYNLHKKAVDGLFSS